MSSTDIRIRYPEGTIGTDTTRFAKKVEAILEAAACMNPPSVCDMPSHLIITIATDDLFEVATALRTAKLIS
ncbi:hypothetical protein [Pseudorhodobacter sp.]|uniref:hypothetical protein n=1 Tax=Pseudorhodobacter sp. TaxID=1934400 RepID=UPI002AFEECF5|nr:hypothetical protein [Pseudorhodobacter sp.]